MKEKIKKYFPVIAIVFVALILFYGGWSLRQSFKQGQYAVFKEGYAAGLKDTKTELDKISENCSKAGMRAVMTATSTSDVINTSCEKGYANAAAEMYASLGDAEAQCAIKRQVLVVRKGQGEVLSLNCE